LTPRDSPGDDREETGDDRERPAWTRAGLLPAEEAERPSGVDEGVTASSRDEALQTLKKRKGPQQDPQTRGAGESPEPRKNRVHGSTTKKE